MRRDDFIDFHQIEERHIEIHNRLLNWSRWCNGRGAPATSPMFRLYIAPARARSREEASMSVSVPVDKDDAVKIAKAVVALPADHRAALNWHYVKPVNPARAARSLGVSLDGLASIVRNARQMLLNKKT
jgi:DNA-directed RNA polymerase specialized sigma24 family protein